MNIFNVIKSRKASFLSSICAILEPLSLWVGSKPTCDIGNRSLMVSSPAQAKHKRYTFSELMVGVTPEKIEALNAATAWALEGPAMGEELV